MSNEDFERAWPLLEPAVLRARQETKETLFDNLASGTSKLWLMPNSALVSRIVKYPNGRKALMVWLAGGELSELQDLANGAGLQDALDNGCNEMRIISGRRGWLRALGWREAGTVAVRDLEDA